ncbi:MAG: acylphosphatase [Acetobacteraceae bacterium]
MAAKRLILRGRVQGVGFRAWLVAQAEAVGVDGWVRNRSDGAVEALLSGGTDAVEELARLCRRGPPLAKVASIVEDLAEPPEYPGFRSLG